MFKAIYCALRNLFRYDLSATEVDISPSVGYGDTREQCRKFMVNRGHKFTGAPLGLSSTVLVQKTTAGVPLGVLASLSSERAICGTRSYPRTNEL